MITRTFYKVGNGLFVVEQTNELINVYDCGGQSKKVIEGAIDRFTGENRLRINNLFISHYDCDHINGLWLLLCLCDCDRIFLPLIHPLVRIVDYAHRRYDYHFSDFIFNPEEFIPRYGGNIDIIHVEEGGLKELDNLFFPTKPDEVVPDGFKMLPLDGNTQEIHNGSNFFINGWMFRIYNRRVMTGTELTNFMDRLGLNFDASLDDILAVLKNKNTDLKKALRQVFSDKEMKLINDYSMTVWSGPSDLDEIRGCLFTGDYNAKSAMEQISSVYGDLRKRTEIVQIPHHGSSYNFNMELCDPSFNHIFSSSDGPYRSRKIVNPTITIDLLKSKGLKYSTTFESDLLIYD